MSRYRSSSVTFQDEPQRWDREKFERFRQRDPYERDDYRYEERERLPLRRDVVVEDRIDRRGPRGSYDEDFRYYEEDRFAPGRRRMDFMDEPIPAEVANRALAPYRRREYVEPPPRRPARPGMIRRQSSLDTFDRRPIPRYDADYRLPSDMPIPLPIRRPRSPPRRAREEFDEVSYRDLPTRGRNAEEYRDIRIKRETRSRSRAAASVRSSSSSSSSFEEIVVPEPPKIGKRGKTRMPKRLVHKQAIIEMSLPFEEEEDFIIVQRALTKEHIDGIIEKSKVYKEEKTVYKYTSDAGDVKDTVVDEHIEDDGTTIKKTTIIEGLPPPPPPASIPPPPPPASVRAPSPARTERSHYTSHTHHHAPPPPPPESVRFVHEDQIVESNHIGGPLTVLAPQNRHRSEDEIRREIRDLEDERRSLRLERNTDIVRRREVDEGYEIIEREDRWNDTPRKDRARSKSVIRVEKDRKGRMALVRSTH